jgi:NRPS condensation-like uncharacterized protein
VCATISPPWIIHAVKFQNHEKERANKSLLTNFQLSIKWGLWEKRIMVSCKAQNKVKELEKNKIQHIEFINQCLAQFDGPQFLGKAHYYQN